MNHNNRDQLIFPGERLDDLGRKGYHVIQDPGKFCFGMDAVLLSAFAGIRKGEHVLDLGSGTGILPILLTARYPVGSVTGLEIQPEMADMASRSVQWNDLQEKITIVQGDICQASALFGKAVFDVVISNPPYIKYSHGLCNPSDSRAVSRHEILCSLEDVAREAALTLKPGGHFFMVHRPQRLSEIMEALSRHHLQPKRMRLVYPYLHSEANMVLIDSVRGGQPGMKAEPPLIVFSEPNVYTEEVKEIYGI